MQELVDIGMALAGEQDMSALLESIVEHARSFARADGGMLFLRAADRLRLVVAHDATETPDVVEEVASTGRAVNRGSALVVPLQERSGEVLGVLALLNARDDDGRPIPFDPCYDALLSSLAAHAAVAVRNARSYGEAQERLRTTGALLAVAQALSRHAPVEEMMRRVGREIARALGADMVGTYFLNARKDALLPVAGYRLPKEHLETFRRLSLSLDRWPGKRDALREQRVIWSSNAQSDPRFDCETLRKFLPHSLLFAPTVARGEAVGGISIVWWQTGREFLPIEIQLIKGLAAQVGLALENVDLVRQTEAKLKETETLLAVSRALSSTLDVNVLMRHFMRCIARVVNADVVGSYLLHDDGEWLVPLQGYRLPPEQLEALRELQLSIVQHAFYAEGARTKRPVISTDVMRDPGIPEALRRVLPHKSQLYVPIVAKDRVVGALLAAWWDRAREFSESELALIEAIAAKAGIALENARLFQENRRQVQELSESTRRNAQLFAEVAVARDSIANILASIPSGVVATSTTGAIVLFNRAAEQLTGLSRASVEARGLTVLPTHLRDALETAVMCGPRVYPELVIHQADLVRTATCTTARLHNHADEVVGAVAVFSDLAPFRELERQRARAERLATLQDLTHALAHEIANPLVPIKSLTRLVSQRASDPGFLADFTRIVTRELERMERLVARLRSVGRRPVTQLAAPVDVRNAVLAAIEVLTPLAAEQGTELDHNIDGRALIVLGDTAEFEELCINLLKNALEAVGGAAGPGRVQVEVVANDGHATISVVDSGPGIRDDVLARLFEPFVTTKSSGTGLGLAICAGIVERAGGRISAANASGGGAVITVQLPIA